MPIDTTSDLVLLSSLSESSIVSALSSRYSSDKIYTYIGTGQVLLAVNPFKQINGLYGPQTLNKYRNKRALENPPHVYAIAEKALQSLRETHAPQCVLVSGESGAGKTENAKRIMEFITSASALSSSITANNKPTNNLSSDTPTTSSIKDKILRSNVLLESFGNAKTLRNDNSSRFGKLMEILFDYGAGIVGGRVTTYLLEKIRITTAKKGERNFHIFYQLCEASCRGEYAEELGLGQAECYQYLSRTECIKVNKISDLSEFHATEQSMDSIGISSDEKISLFKICAAILNLGNIEFGHASSEGSCISPQSEEFFAWVAFHLCVEDSVLRHQLTHRKIEVNGEVFEKPLTPEDAVRSRDSLAMSLYANAFTDIVKKLNLSMECSGNESSRIGILDIYGFEIFEDNSMEQLHINYCNEKLQQLFIELTLRAEQEEYAKEGIQWETVHYFDNAPVLTLIESKRPPGILALMDEESVMPKATDISFGQKLAKHIQNPHFASMGNTHFQIKHYAGDVVYNNAGMLEKNKDQLNKNLLEMLHSSCQNPYVNSLYPEMEKSLKKPPTVSTQFKEQMVKLMDNLHQCNANYVRTIKPNDQKKAGVFTTDMVLNQVTYLGLKENVIVRKAGYAVRQTYAEFFDRYRLICDEVWPFGTGNPQADCLTILASMGVTSGFEQGISRLFIREAQTLFNLEDCRDDKLNMVANKIQNTYRAWIAIKYFKELRKKAEAVFGGKKRRSGSVHLNFHGDYLGCRDSVPMSMALGVGEEGAVERMCDIKFADSVDKVNRKGVVQNRLLVITSQAFYFCSPPLEKTALKSKNALNCLLGLSLSTMADSYLVLHFTDHDYVIVSRRKAEIVMILKERYQSLLNSELPIDFSDSFQYKTFGGGIFRSKSLVMNSIVFREEGSLPNGQVTLTMQSGTMVVSVPVNLCSRAPIGLSGSDTFNSAAANFASGASSYGKTGGGTKPISQPSQTNVYTANVPVAKTGFGGPPKNPYSSYSQSAASSSVPPPSPSASAIPPARTISPPRFTPPVAPTTPTPSTIPNRAMSPIPVGPPKFGGAAVGGGGGPPKFGGALPSSTSPPPSFGGAAVVSGPPKFGGISAINNNNNINNSIAGERPKSISRNTPVPPPKKSQPPPPMKKKRAVALYDYAATEAGELTISEGDEVEIMKEDDSGWWKAKFEGNEGLIPSNYVKML